MAEKLNDSETVSFDELVLANTIQIDALSQLLIEKGRRLWENSNDPKF